MYIELENIAPHEDDYMTPDLFIRKQFTLTDR